MMKVLSIRQPWASLIIHCGKNIENRTWRTSHRGPLLIHASRNCSRAEYEEARQLIAERNIHLLEPMPWFTNLPLGCIVGRVELLDCEQHHDSPWFVGPNGYVLASAKPLPHIKLKGKLGLFDAPHEVLRSLMLEER